MTMRDKVRKSLMAVHTLYFTYIYQFEEQARLQQAAFLSENTKYIKISHYIIKLSDTFSKANQLICRWINKILIYSQPKFLGFLGQT